MLIFTNLLTLLHFLLINAILLKLFTFKILFIILAANFTTNFAFKAFKALLAMLLLLLLKNNKTIKLKKTI